MYTKKQLVSFGNYLLERYKVQEYTSDGSNLPIYQRLVHDADLCNWQDRSPEKSTELAEPIPCDTPVLFSLDVEKDIPKQAVVRGIHLYPSEVKYDLIIQTPGYMTTRIYNIESRFVWIAQKE